ncbi:TetR/AcrR family transcriptional regulator, partial [Liquorilactobacillus satsumensis]
DLRKFKTKRNLEQAFIKLLKTKDFAKITIGDICKVAFTSRSTFYLHYLDKFDLLEKVFNKQVEDFELIVKKRLKSLMTLNWKMSIEQFYAELIAHKESILVLFQINVPQYNLQNEFKRVIESYLRAYFTQHELSLEVDVDLATQIAAGVIFEILNWTFEHGIDNRALKFAEKMRVVLIED